MKMKQRNYVAPSVSERASRIRTSILAGSGVDPLHGNDVGFADTRVRTNVESRDRDNETLLNF